MNNAKVGAAPYFIVLLAAIFLFYRTTQFGFEAPGGRVGPDLWPRIVLGLLALVCVYEIVRRLIFRAAGTRRDGAVAPLESDLLSAEMSAAVEDAQPSYPWVLAIGVAMSVAYVALLATLGFFLCTAIYLAGFIRLGGYRRIGVNLATSLLGSLAFMFVFMKVVYISLPLGVEPFAQVSFLLMRLMGVN